MVSERINDDPYFQELVPAGEVVFSRNDAQQLYLQVHTSDETYSDKWDRELGIELSVPCGVRTYVHIKPCILTPRIMLTVVASEPSELVAMSPANILGTSVGKVIESEVQGMERREIGNGQAWFYPSDNILVLWECEIFHSFSAGHKDPAANLILVTAWEAFERVLLEKFADVQRIVTPGWEPKYTNEQWQLFLRARGYAPENNNPQAFIKRID